MHPEQRLRLRLIFTVIIVATLPCYCLGWIVVRVADIQAAMPTLTPTAPPTWTWTPVFTFAPTLTAPASDTPAPPTELPTITPTATLFFTWTPLPTWTPTDTLPPPPTETIPPPITDTPAPTDTQSPDETPTQTAEPYPGP